ncbi:DUF3426 domain-containing protein [Desulfolutivibrio sulfoxidireducens]|uniref:DUF3426 domain-containing protein n=1 Tax=Desulfolutivibrio sulfoxidireducens TaxID=2773299 RepID=UPI00159E733D|nr:DUF3426 domain-containing protein [Desulfolutivibrio sulfoxidireducens]QLA16947.1 DUF3426 domain-containing protein [Desulfolutivibrio sulfoxidireducens]
MIITCPNCASRFRLPDEKIGPDGVKLRCGKCKHVFHQQPPSPPDMRDFDYPESDETPGGAFDATTAPKRAAPSRESEPSGLAAPDESSDREPGDLFHSETYEDEDDQAPVRPGFNLDDVANIDISGQPGKGASAKDTKRRALIVALCLFGVAVVTLGALYFLGLWPGTGKEGTPPATEQAPTKETAAKDGERTATQAPPAGAEETAKVKDIVLQNVRQYYVTNEKAGQLFVIEGKAVNNFKSPKEMIKLEAALFDEKGTVLVSKDILSGNAVSLFQLQVMTRQELESALSSQVGVLTNNTNLATGAETPFMIVFFDPPEAVKEFGVKVVDVKDPPGQ